MGDDEKVEESQQATNSADAAKESASAAENEPAAAPAAPASKAEPGENPADKSNEGSTPKKDTATSSPSSKAADESSDKKSTEEDTAVTTSENEDQEEPTPKPSTGDGSKPVATVASNKKERPPYKYDPNKITLRFLFANKDGLTVTVECKPTDTVGEVKGALLSVWPDDLPDCAGGELLRLVCMGKGFLMPDSRTLEDLQIPVFKTHPTPVNVSVKMNDKGPTSAESPTKKGESGGDGTALTDGNTNTDQTGQGCACSIL